ncbi:nitroreductase family deazaflavin-dependent oxidoreductase [Antrihabitans cavernicola]|uniref:Nitroreductase family deazaflavin-dependent oxidoreductase n=1 Tax=Antrihabitans cavernicola TaxID=2495913 RepID=A0A5A7SCH6_9NOCA|nr:nitroreductase family deazaflavin-dependent oxidoreductase [Spelaeibacter cavernicola]KAA0023274.1 nitroreductase family deazaflavin-dependent oxidoreductase [Spelaeibacter cavernicola]
MVDFLKIADLSWPVLKPVFRGHVAVYRATGGRIGRRIPGTPPMLLLDHVGAKSGAKRTSPLVYMPVGEDFVIVAAKGGYPGNPDWLYNLRAHPDVDAQIGARRVQVHARELDAEERSQLWPAAAEYNSQWRRYQRRTDRTIPLVVLEPQSG